MEIWLEVILVSPRSPEIFSFGVVHLKETNVKQTNINSRKGWLKEITIREYPYSSAGEIAARHGVCSGSVWYWVKKLNLQQTDETKARILKKKHRCIANIIKTNPEVKRKSMETKKRTWKMERFRVMSGMPQKTKLRIAMRPTKAYRAIWYLVNMRNYFRDIEVGGRFTLYYDEQTKRSGKEDYYTKSCGLTFEQVQD